MVSLAQESRAADSRSSPRGNPAGPGGTDVGACLGCACRASGPVQRGRPAALSGRAGTAVPDRGPEAAHDHEEGPLQEEPALTPGRVGAALSRIAGVLALSRTVVKQARFEARAA